MSLLVAVIEVIGPRIVEVHGLLDQAQAEHARIEVHVRLRIPRDRGDVMDASDLSVHAPAPFTRSNRNVFHRGSAWSDGRFPSSRGRLARSDDGSAASHGRFV
jgi:hypothetical protein